MIINLKSSRKKAEKIKHLNPLVKLSITKEKL